MAASDASPFPIKNQAYRVMFPILDADGDLVAGAAGLDSEISKDAGTFADVTAEATQVATSSGMYYLDLTATEMNADTVALIIKTSTSGAKTTPIVLYPVTLADAMLGVNVTQWLGTTVATPTTNGVPEVDVTFLAGSSQSLLDLQDFADAGYNPATNVLTGLPAIPTDWITASGIAAGALDGKGDWNIDKTGYSLSTAGILGIWHQATSAIVTTSTIGLQVKANLDAVITDRTLAAAAYFDPATDTVVNVTNVATLTGHTVQTGDSFARIGAAGAGLTNINLPDQTMDITGSLSGSVGSISGITFPTNFADLAITVTDGEVTVGTNTDKAGYSISGSKTTLDALNDIAATEVVSSGAITTSSGAVTTVTGVTNRVTANADQIDGSAPAAANLKNHALETLSVTFSAGGSTTEAVLNLVEGSAASSTNDVYNGRILVFNTGTLDHQVAEITDYVGSTKTATISAVTTPPTTSHTARMI